MKEDEIAALLAWYERNKRSMPWREDPSPYHVYISEIMLQQTRVEAVRPYYLRFLAELPDIGALAEAREERLLKLWEGLGYYSRARNLKKTAEIVVRDYGGELPKEAEELKKLPGIGDYTAGAISSIAYRQPETAVDGNVLRVLSRLRGDGRNIVEEKTRKAVKEELKQELAEAGLKPELYRIFNQAVMDLGETVCLPNGAPLCEMCPLNGTCIAHKEGKELELPVKTRPKKRRIEKRTVLLIQRGDRVLLKKRPESGLLAGMYEFPNISGHIKREELLAALRTEGTGTTALPEEAAEEILTLPSAKHIFSHIEWEMEGYLVRLPDDGRADAYGEAEITGKTEAEAKPETEETWALREELLQKYSIPSAFRVYTGIALEILG